MIDTLPDNAMILKSVLAVKLVMQLKILNIVNKTLLRI
ncbi:hypothetical protein BANRA_00613 [Escherichia coli]|nr:hypothetical protein BANRA_00613 [Escherichia coli]VCW54507.1 hypothetical protein BANRA_02716 [Escherichia coli]VCY50927.1 hypothetical protein BANRA_02128 [Escherichia coli]VCY75085.1 hypothetical protein BANRA_04933 [Escherichia coli]VCZ24640.1 hypothetical protein BANRA_02901 [Escherichia coli]